MANGHYNILYIYRLGKKNITKVSQHTGSLDYFKRNMTTGKVLNY